MKTCWTGPSVNERCLAICKWIASHKGWIGKRIWHPHIYHCTWLAPHISANSCVQAKSAEIGLNLCSGLYQLNPKPHYYNQVVSKLELDCTHTFGHGQLSLSTSVYTKVPSDAYALSAIPHPFLSWQPCSHVLYSFLLSPMYFFFFISAFFSSSRAWNQNWYLFQASPPQIQRSMAKGISQGYSTWPMTCQSLACMCLTLGTVKVHFRQHWSQLNCSRSTKCTACWMHCVSGAWG